jgi:hypothetical protein
MVVLLEKVQYMCIDLTANKAGSCPPDNGTDAEGQCRRECNDDADCRGVGKCCARGCSQLCLAPYSAYAPQTTTYSPGTHLTISSVLFATIPYLCVVSNGIYTKAAGSPSSPTFYHWIHFVRSSMAPRSVRFGVRS